MIIFEVIDKSGRKIRLTQKQWAHVIIEHPGISEEEIKQTLIMPLKINPSDDDPKNVKWYYRYNKEFKRYLLVSVKYLNGDGFVITAHKTTKIQ